MSSSRGNVTINAPRARRSTKESAGGGSRKPPSHDVKTAARSRKFRNSKEEVKWKVEEKWAPVRRLSTPELGTARQIFFNLDKDGSGSIDAEELGGVMRTLGQTPTEEEIKELIKSVDEGDCDGKIQLREFFTLYARGLDTQNVANNTDINNVFMAFGGDLRDKESSVNAEVLHDKIMEEFDLDVDVAEAFGQAKEGYSKEDVYRLMLEQRPLTSEVKFRR